MLGINLFFLCEILFYLGAYLFHFESDFNCFLANYYILYHRDAIVFNGSAISNV